MKLALVALRCFALGVLLWVVPALGAPSLDQAYRAMYDLDFGSAHQVLQQFETTNPADPMGPVSEAAADLFAEFDRLRILQSEFFLDDNSFLRREHSLAPNPEAKHDFEAALEKSGHLASEALRRDPNDESAALATLLGTGLHADYLALIEKRNMAALTEVKQSRTLAESLIAKHPHCYDAYLAIGVENYLLSLKAAPVRWLLRMGGAQTDRQAGIEHLRITAEKGHLLQPYARLLLAVAALRANDRTAARNTLTALASQFPHNRLYREELAKIRP